MITMSICCWEYMLFKVKKKYQYLNIIAYRPRSLINI